MIAKEGESIHLKKIPNGRKEIDHVKKSTKKAAEKPSKNGRGPGLKVQPLFPLGWVLSAIFLPSWELTKQL